MLVVVALVGAGGLVSADTDTSDASDRIGDMMPNDHSEHHDGEHNHETHNPGDHHDGDHNHEDHDHGEHHSGGSHC